MSFKPISLVSPLWLLAVACLSRAALAEQPTGATQSRSAVISSGAANAQALPPLPANNQLRMRADQPLWNSPGQSEVAVRTAEHLQELPVPVPVKSLASTSSASAIPLKPPSSALKEQAPKSGSSTLQMVMSVGSSLLLVLGLFFGVAWCFRKTANSAAGMLPEHVVAVLGRTPLAARQHVVLLRFGPKLVLVGVAQGEARTISEITDPLEVDRIAGQCESAKPGSISNSFRSVLHQVGRES